MGETYQYLKVYFDGGSRGNPGPSAVGTVLYDDKGINNQIKKVWKIKDKNILKVYLEISQKLSKYNIVDLRLIPREDNIEADSLVNKALNKEDFIYKGESGINFGKIND